MFDIIIGFVIDSMHAVFHGVMKDLLHRIMRSLSLFKLDEVNIRINNVRLPHEVPRAMRPLTDFTKGNWRVSELRMFAYLAPVLLRGLVPISLYNNILLFITAMYYLHSFSLSEDNLSKCQRQIQRFCRQLGSIYNDKSVYTYNVHVLLHLPLKVRQAGPLYTHSCDEFEMLFGKMLTAQHGTRGASNQIMRYSCLKTTLDTTALQLAITNQPLADLCERIMTKQYATFYNRVNSSTVVLGKCTVKTYNRLSADTANNTGNRSITAKCYNKCVHYGTLLKVTSVCKLTKRVDCYIYVKHKFYILHDIAVDNAVVSFICKRVKVTRLCSMTNTAKLELRFPLCKIHSIESSYVSLKLLQTYVKCCTISVHGETYLLPLPTRLHRS